MSPNPVNQGSSFNREEAMEDCKLKEPDDPADCFNRLPLARSGSILRRTFCFLLVAALLFITAHRLPAPIQEIPESPTPAPQKAKPKPTRTIKSKDASGKAENSTKRQTTSSPLQQQPKFRGTWRGTLPFGPAGDLHLTLVINNDGTSVTESGGLSGTITFKATNDGNVVSWRSGAFNAIAWTLTPNPDEQTALLTAKGPFIGSPSAVFRKAPP